MGNYLFSSYYGSAESTKENDTDVVICKKRKRGSTDPGDGVNPHLYHQYKWEQKSKKQKNNIKLQTHN